MDTPDHPIRHWSRLTPWDSSLESIRYRGTEIVFTFYRGGREFEAQLPLTHFPSMYRARTLRDTGLQKALEGATFHQALAQLKQTFEYLDTPGSFCRTLSMFNSTIIITPRTISQGHYRYENQICRLVQVEPEPLVRAKLYNWEHLEVLEVFGGGSFKVRAKNEVFGCVLFKTMDCPADEAYGTLLDRLAYLDNLLVSPEELAEDDDPGLRAPRFEGVVRVDDYSRTVVGFLYQWIDPWMKASCLGQMNRDDLRYGRGNWLLRECYGMFENFRKRGIPVTAAGRGENALNMISVDGLGYPFIRLPDLGTFKKVPIPLDQKKSEGPHEKYVFTQEENGDKVALKKLSCFLLPKPRGARELPPLAKRSARYKPAQSPLELLPREVLNIILEYSLERPEVHCTELGFRCWPPLDGEGLWETSHFLRNVALEQFMRNHFVVDFKFLGTFLRHVAGIKYDEYDRLISGEDKIEEDFNLYWAALKEITLLVSFTMEQESRHWYSRSGSSLAKLLLEKSKDQKESRKTKVHIAIVYHDSDQVRDFPSLIRSLQSFSNLASTNVYSMDGRRKRFCADIYRAIVKGACENT